MVRISLRLSLKNLARKETLAPERDYSLAIKIGRVQAPEPHVRMLPQIHTRAKEDMLS